MRKKSTTVSINIISVLVILMCLLLGVVAPANAWFTDNDMQGVKIVVEVGDLKVKLYQNSIADANEISTNIANTENNTNKYISLSTEIKPDVPVDLVLWLANKDLGSTAMFVRYKFQIFVRPAGVDTEIDGVTISGYDAPSGSTNGFVDGQDGYYYYKNSSGSNVLFAQNAQAKIMQKFTVPFSAFIDSDGDMINTNSETIYLKLTVEASVSSNFDV